MQEPILRQGDTGEDVKTLQQLLNSKTYLLLPEELLEVDGIFGAVTQNAVRRFQEIKGLDVDGVVGSDTWKKLREDEGDL